MLISKYTYLTTTALKKGSVILRLFRTTAVLFAYPVSKVKCIKYVKCGQI